MSEQHDCSWVETVLFTYLDGALAEPQSVRVEQHVGQCAACAELAERLGDVFTDIAEEDPLTWLEQSPEIMLEGILAAVTEGESEEATAQPKRRESRRWVGLVAALILGALVTALGMRWMGSRSDGQTSRPIAALEQTAAIAPGGYGLSQDDPGEPEAHDEVTLGSRGTAHAEGWVVEVPRESAVERVVLGVDVRPSHDARWTYTADQHQLELSHGTLLVEYVPQSGAPALRVAAPQLDIEVVGTVFLVQTDGETSGVSVVVGAVDARQAGAGDDALRLTQGVGLAPDGSLVAVEPVVIEQVSAHIDLDLHERQVARTDVSAMNEAPSTHRASNDGATPHGASASTVVAALEPSNRHPGAGSDSRRSSDSDSITNSDDRHSATTVRTETVASPDTAGTDGYGCRTRRFGGRRASVGGYDAGHRPATGRSGTDGDGVRLRVATVWGPRPATPLQ